MYLNKLLFTAAAVALPLGLAQAQAPATSDTTAATPTDQSTPAPAAEGSVDQSAAGSTATTADASAAPAQSAQPVAASKADLKKGETVLGKDGGVVGKIESVSADGAVINSGKARATIPTASFGKTDQGLVIAMSKTEFEKAAGAKSPS